MINFTQQTNALVGLDLSEMDEALLKYIVYAQQIFTFKHITFIHNIKISELPEEYQSVANLEKISIQIKKRIQQKVSSILPEEINYAIEVLMEDFSELAFLKFSKTHVKDLLILGNKQGLEGNGGLPQKLVRVIPQAAVLLVPETFQQANKQIVGAIDFSKYSQAINQLAGSIIAQNADFQYRPVHVAKISWPIFVGLHDRVLENSLSEEIEKKKQRWTKEFPQAPALEIIKAKDKNIASVLLQYVKQQKSQLLILGVKGATSLTGLFLGGVANEVIQRETDCALLYIKIKA